ncbi:hypothetical protein B9G55_02825 [Saccharibacillus sp. O16]|nr:hypothetical protein B9G55_02825 [Saccharibacillus sp. O16]
MRRPGIAGFIILGLAALGIFQIISKPSWDWLIPLAVVAIVTLLYFLLPNAKRPSGFRQGGSKQPKIKPSARTQEKLARMSSSGGSASKPSASRGSKPAPTTAKKRKNYPFQVIEGRKGKDDDNIPKFH